LHERLKTNHLHFRKSLFWKNAPSSFQLPDTTTGSRPFPVQITGGNIRLTCVLSLVLLINKSQRKKRMRAQISQQIRRMLTKLSGRTKSDKSGITTLRFSQTNRGSARSKHRIYVTINDLTFFNKKMPAFSGQKRRIAATNTR